MNYFKSVKAMTTLPALGVYILITIWITYPLIVGLGNLTVLYQYTDALLQGWTLKWDVHSFLSGVNGIQQIWDANIFYPYPRALAFSEHLLPSAMWLMPVVLLGRTPLVAANLGALIATVLSGWGVYLLVTWLTGHRWAGLVAGLFFAVAPFRISHISQLHLLTTQWIPFTFLAMARLIKFNRRRDLILLIIFTNLQFLSVINYAPLVAIALGLWTISYMIVYRRFFSGSLWLGLLLFGVVTWGLNWPILQIYGTMSNQMGILRTLGDARVYGAFFLNYILPVGNSLLYGRLLHLPTHIDYLFPDIGIFLSTFPGFVVFILASIGVILGINSQSGLRITTLTLLIITLTGFVLSFGANDLAFGEKLAPIVKSLLPYPYLYQVFPFLQGLRVPIRFALLTTYGLAILAGFGFTLLGRRWWPNGNKTALVATLMSGLILLEHLPAPLPVQTVTYGGQLPTWLATNTPTDAVILELPYYLHTKNSNSELLREYQSAGHWRRLVNGASGFKPIWLVQLGRVFDSFPDWRSFDVARQLGVNYLVLHHNQYESAAWDNIVGLLPGYLSAIRSIHSVGDNLILQLHPPTCSAEINQVQVDATAFPALTFTNTGPAAFVADPRLPSHWQAGGQSQEFLEPLFIAAGQTVTMTLPAPAPDSQWQVDLANQKRSLSPEEARVGQPASSLVNNWQPVQIPFADGTTLQAVALSDESAHPCGSLQLSLQWNWPEKSDNRVSVKLLDRFGRFAVDNLAHPLLGAEATVSTHILPLAETVPPGQYQLQVQLFSSHGVEIPAVGPDGAPVAQPLALPVVVHPPVTQVQAEPVAQLENGVSLLKADLPQWEFQPGEWVRFSLTWQAVEKLAADFTVFTQFLGPDGKVYGQHDNPPSGGWYPTSLWQLGEVVQDEYAVRLDSAAPAGDYRLVVGMYDSASGQRVPASHGGDFIEAGKLTVIVP